MFEVRRNGALSEMHAELETAVRAAARLLRQSIEAHPPTVRTPIDRFEVIDEDGRICWSQTTPVV